MRRFNLRWIGRALESAPKAERAAREFADLVGAIVNSTVSHAPVTLAAVGEELWYVAHVGADKLPAPLPLTNGQYLFLYHSLGVRREERYLATLEYRYVYQATFADDSWIFRYEYIREPPEGYAYAREHLHVNASPLSYSGASPFPGLHLPTGRRVTVERLCRHLIAEHGVEPISPDWEEMLKQGEAHFREVQRRLAAE